MKSCILSAVLIVLFVTACNGTFEVGLEHSPAEPATPLVLPTVVQVPTGTSVPAASPSPQRSPTLQVHIDTPVPTNAPTVHTVQIYLIAINDKGQGGQPVGCGDSVIPVQVEIPPTQGILKAALVKMLSVKDQYYGESGLYNALYQSNLKVESVSINAGKASVYLTGTLKMGGECDAPRVQAQLEETVLQFSTVTEADIFINGKPLREVLSLKG
jgi:hypothetical protein